MSSIPSSKYSATLFILLFCMPICAHAVPDKASRASEWFARDEASTETVQAGNGVADYAFLAIGCLGLVAMGGLLWRQRRREREMLGRLRKAEERLQDAQAIAGIGSWTRDFATGDTYWSAEAREVLMLEDEPAKWGHYETYVHPDDYSRVVEVIARAYCQGGTYRCDHQLICPTGVQKHIRLVGRVYLEGKGGGAVYEHGTVQDITERKLIELHLRENEEKLQTILDAAPTAILIFDLSDNFIIKFANPSVYQLFSLSLDCDLASLKASDYWVSPDTFSLFRASLQNRDALVQSDALLRKSDGASFWGGVRAQIIQYHGAQAVLVCVQDITEQRAHLEELEQRATRDPVTGVLNSHSLQETAVKEFRRAVRYNQPVAVCVIGLDQLRAVNEGFGHVAAEQIIRQFVDMLKDCVRVEDSIGRLAQEEFALLLVGATLEGGRLVAERLRAMCEEEYFELQRQHIRLTVSVGVAGMDAPLESVDEVFKRAMEGLQQARRMGANCVATRAGLASDHQKKA